MSSSYGFLAGANGCLASPSVQLARRVLQLERLNSSLRKEVEAASARGLQLQEEVSVFVGSIQSLSSTSSGIKKMGQAALGMVLKVHFQLGIHS